MMTIEKNINFLIALIGLCIFSMRERDIFETHLLMRLFIQFVFTECSAVSDILFSNDFQVREWASRSRRCFKNLCSCKLVRKHLLSINVRK